MSLRETIADAVAWTGPISEQIVNDVMNALEDRAQRRDDDLVSLLLAEYRHALWECGKFAGREGGDDPDHIQALAGWAVDAVRELRVDCDEAEVKAMCGNATANRLVVEEQRLQAAIANDPTNPHLQGRLAGLQRARDIAAEGSQR